MLFNFLKRSVKNVNEKISNLVKSGDIIRLKRGVYCMGKDYTDNTPDVISIANLLYAPSYVSFEYALSFYGMIPEHVSEITSATMKHPKHFETPLGRFRYVKVPQTAYALGVDWLYDEKEGGKFIATPEKALCDKIRYDRGIGTLTQKSMREYLLYDLRLEYFTKLDATLTEAIASAYRSRNLQTLSKVIAKGKLL
jgi:predicted transcriptional regulator of viral defense system